MNFTPIKKDLIIVADIYAAAAMANASFTSETYPYKRKLIYN